LAALAAALDDLVVLAFAGGAAAAERMRTLQRYLWREIATATLFVLLALLSLFTFFELINQLDDVGRAGYQLGTAFTFVLLKTPALASELMPIAALIGTIYALSKLAANSEFTIMRVAGMSTRRLANSVARIGFVLVLFTYAFAEFVAPPAEALAQRVRLSATGTTIAQQFRSGVWVRDVVRDGAGQVQRLRFVNVGQVRPDTSVHAWRLFEFDSDYRLRSMSTAASGVYVRNDGKDGAAPSGDGPGWLLTQVIETRLPQVAADTDVRTDARTEIVRHGEMMWRSELTPEIFGVLLVQPERMAALNLWQYIRHLSDNRQQTERYEIAFWNKLIYPLAVLVMMALALPFAYLHVRAGTVSLKIFAGVMIGVGFYMLNKLFGHLGLLNTWPPVIVAVLPSLVMLSIALSALYWIERR
jgi:lipopolysaccharide export system permease protein